MELEAKGVGALILGRFKTTFPPRLFAKAKGWLAAGLLANWASVDTLCPNSMGAFLVRYPAYVGKIKSWAFHPNRWVKRAALVSFIKLARKAEFLPAVYEISASVFDVNDDLVQKANGWLLREAGKADPSRLERFLRLHGPAMPRTTVRYAIERYPEARRNALLLATRSKADRQAAATMLADIGQASWVRDGQSRHLIYVFFDPNCPFCHKVYQDLRPQVERGEVELRWIPIAVLMTTSLGQGRVDSRYWPRTRARHSIRMSAASRATPAASAASRRNRYRTTTHSNASIATWRCCGAAAAIPYRPCCSCTRDGKTHFIVGAPPQQVLTQILRELE